MNIWRPSRFFKCRPLPWEDVLGVRAAAELQWLERTAGPQAVRKFLGGKLRTPHDSGQFLLESPNDDAGRELIFELIIMLRQGKTIPVYDVVSYHAHGGRWFLGMALHRGRLVDVWQGSVIREEHQAATKAHP